MYVIIKNTIVLNYYSKEWPPWQQGRNGKKMKISGLEKCVLALTLAFLVFLGGYFLGGRNTGEPYTVSTQTRWTEEVGAAMPEVETPAGGSVDINTATALELQALPGIGAVRAEEIVADREANGPFRIPEDITRVPGIGQGTLEEIIDRITVE